MSKDSIDCILNRPYQDILNSQFESCSISDTIFTAFNLNIFKSQPELTLLFCRIKVDLMKEILNETVGH